MVKVRLRDGFVTPLTNPLNEGSYSHGSARNYRDNPIKIVFHVPDAAAAVEAIRAEGLEIVREAATSPGMGGALIGFGKDPDGYLVELIQRPAREGK